MTLLLTSPRFLDHDTGRHPERAERLIQVTRHLDRQGLAEKCARPSWKPLPVEKLGTIHDTAYAAEVAEFARAGGGRIEADTLVSPDSYDVALYAAGAACEATRRVVGGQARNALCLVRPPGHHALRDSVMGFCLFNNVALAAATATGELDVERVLIVDWDVHHGNGTQDAFWTDPQVGFLSIHRWPFYPGSGRDDETGSGPGLGTIFNLPTEMGTSRSAYLDHFRAGLEELAERMKPQLILISAGFDAHRDDPVGSLGLEVEDFEVLSNLVLDLAEDCCGGRVVSVLEGGYNPGILAACVETHLECLLARDTTQPEASDSP